MESITIGDAINNIQGLYSKGVKSRDSRLSPRLIYNFLINNRATILKQQINKNQSVSQWSYQSLNCVELESVKSSIGGSKILLRSTNKIPTPILGLSKSTITNVTTIDGDIKFDLTTFENLKYSVGKKFTATKPSIYIKDQRLYVNYITKLKGISLSGLFYDPIEAVLFPSLCDDCDDCKCADYQKLSFPLDGDTLNTVLKLTANNLILFMQSKEDKFNNANDDSMLGNQMIHQPQNQNNEE